MGKKPKPKVKSTKSKQSKPVVKLTQGKQSKPAAKLTKGEQSKPVAKLTKGEQSKSVAKPSYPKHPKGVEIRVVNIVVSTAFEKKIPLEKMAATLPNTEYNPEQFPGLVIRIKDPKTSALVFSSGKVVCTGARTMEDVRESIRKIIKSLLKIDVKVKIKPIIKIQNIVASGTVGIPLNLNILAMKLKNTEYEPEQFPGLVYKLIEAKATFLLFSNGKVVCTGTKSEEEVHRALDMLVVNLKKVM